MEDLNLHDSLQQAKKEIEKAMAPFAELRKQMQAIFPPITLPYWNSPEFKSMMQAVGNKIEGLKEDYRNTADPLRKYFSDKGWPMPVEASEFLIWYERHHRVNLISVKNVKFKNEDFRLFSIYMDNKLSSMQGEVTQQNTIEVSHEEVKHIPFTQLNTNKIECPGFATYLHFKTDFVAPAKRDNDAWRKVAIEHELPFKGNTIQQEYARLKNYNDRKFRTNQKHYQDALELFKRFPDKKGLKQLQAEISK